MTRSSLGRGHACSRRRCCASTVLAAEAARRLLERLQHDGEVLVSNAVIDGSYFLRACIVNFRTTEDDIQALTKVVTRVGSELRPSKVG